MYFAVYVELKFNKLFIILFKLRFLNKSASKFEIYFNRIHLHTSNVNKQTRKKKLN